MEGFVAGLAERGDESGEREMIFRSWGEFCGDGVQYVRYPFGLCAVLDCVRDPVVHSPVTSLSRHSFPPSFHLARSLTRFFARLLSLPAFLPHSSTWFYHAITCTIDHARWSARSRKREIEMNGGRGKRSRELATKLTFYLFYIDRVTNAWLFLRIFAYKLFFIPRFILH